MSTVTEPPTSPPKTDRPARPARTEEPLGFNDRIAATLTKHVGSMWVVYFTTLFTLAWIALAIFGPLHSADPYPFAFLLFLGNVVQLLLVFVILVGQQVLGRAADKRSLRTFEDAEAIFKQVEHIHKHMEKQDMILNRGIALVDAEPHPWISNKLRRPRQVRDEYVGLNGRIAAGITQLVGSMWAFYLAALFQFGWMGLALAGLIRFDPYPFAFLLFLSSITQLILMFVIMVGQDVMGRSGEHRAEQTFLDTEAVLHEANRLEHHLTAQDRLIVKICGYIEEYAPKDHPIHADLGLPPVQERTTP